MSNTEAATRVKKNRRNLTRPFIHNPLYCYIRARKLEGTFEQGPKPKVRFINCYRIKVGWGHVPISVYPYDAKVWPPVEPVGLDSIAKFNRCLFYQRLFNLSDIKILLWKKQLTQIAIPITTQWYKALGGQIALPTIKPL